MKISEMEVTLLDSMGSDLSVVNAARVSFDKESDWEYLEPGVHGDYKYSSKELSDKDKKLIKYLAEHNHWSPFSHTSLSFRVKAPLFLARQFAKHQVGGNWNEVSRRYVDSEPEFYRIIWRERPDKSLKQGSSGVVSEEVHIKADEAFWKLVDHSLETYEYLLSLGICPEQARAALLLDAMTEWIWTGSLYFFARVVNLRLDEHAQKECSEIAEPILKYMKELFPVSTEELVYGT